MYGRYGGRDDLNLFLIVVALILSLFAPYTSIWVMLVSDLFMFLALFRVFSRNIVKRTEENRTFREKTAGIRRFFRMVKLNLSDKSHHYVMCPRCHTILRVPKGHGKVEITCRQCGKVFKARS